MHTHERRGRHPVEHAGEPVELPVGELTERVSLVGVPRIERDDGESINLINKIDAEGLVRVRGRRHFEARGELGRVVVIAVEHKEGKPGCVEAFPEAVVGLRRAVFGQVAGVKKQVGFFGHSIDELEKAVEKFPDGYVVKTGNFFTRKMRVGDMENAGHRTNL